MKTTALTAYHRSIQAKMVEFAGYEMPIHYGDLRAEHMAVRNSVGIFDVSHMGEFIVEGEEALDFLQWMLSNDISKLAIGDAQYNYMPNLQGGIVDDLIVYRLQESIYMLVVNAANIQKDWNWLISNNSFDCKLTDRSEEYSLIAVQGPKAPEALQALTKVDLASISFYKFKVGELAGVDEVIISATGYTGSGGFELYMKNNDALTIWKAIMNLNFEGLLACGLGARDSLRLEKGYCLYGNDINDETSPYEAGLSWVTRIKNKEQVAKDQLLQLKENQKRKLVGFEVEGRRIARHGARIVNDSNQTIGEVTSGGLSPVLEVPIGLGYVSLEHLSKSEIIHIDLGRKMLRAEVKKLPLV